MSERERVTASERLKQILRASGHTPYGIAARANLPHTVVTRFLNGERGLSTASFDRICAAYRVRLVTSGRPGNTGPRERAAV